MLLGEIEFVEFDTAKMEQDVASAWHGVDGWTGSSFKPIKFLGKQICKGTNYWFFAEETTVTNPVKKKMVVLAINGFQDHYAIIPSSIHEVQFQI